MNVEEDVMQTIYINWESMIFIILMSDSIRPTSLLKPRMFHSSRMSHRCVTSDFLYRSEYIWAETLNLNVWSSIYSSLNVRHS